MTDPQARRPARPAAGSGAYTTSYASDFNGFAVPRTYASDLVEA
jgi:hypothetical protein